MRKAIFIIPIILLLGLAGLEASDWKDNLEKLIYSKSVSEQDNLIGKIIESNPAWQDVVDYIKSLDFPKPDSTGFSLHHTTCIDGVRRPYVVYLPSDYDAARPRRFWLFSTVAPDEKIFMTTRLDMPENMIFH